MEVLQVDRRRLSKTVKPIVGVFCERHVRRREIRAASAVRLVANDDGYATASSRQSDRH